MSKPDLSPPSADAVIQEEALRVARAVQKPGQTKEQTKLIAQGIAKGIEIYKKQQSAKARERDKQRKRALKLRQAAATEAAEDQSQNDSWNMEPGGVDAALALGGALFALMALAHLLRAFLGWELRIGPWNIPVWVSVAAALALSGLSAWFLIKAKR